MERWREQRVNPEGPKQLQYSPHLLTAPRPPPRQLWWGGRASFSIPLGAFKNFSVLRHSSQVGAKPKPPAASVVAAVVSQTFTPLSFSLSFQEGPAASLFRIPYSSTGSIATREKQSTFCESITLPRPSLSFTSSQIFVWATAKPRSTFPLLAAHVHDQRRSRLGSNRDNNHNDYDDSNNRNHGDC